ncbi:MAG TPA: inositol monophosphatase family protein [Actinomycetota bacterium]|nr:inositol monophosphatase family protein [Actinomycetota bacterium]
MGERDEVQRFREIAVRAAVAAGSVIRDSVAPEAEAKGRGDYVTEVDRAAERAIRAVLETETPDVPVVGEELGGVEAERYWLVDPLDGTVNFIHRFPVVGVSVALMQGGRPAAGVVHAPYLGTTFTAARGQGADQDGRPLKVSQASSDKAVVGTGFPFRYKERLPEYLAMMLPALERFEDLRRPGAVALDLAWVAAGVFDGFFEVALSSWDLAAGALLVEEAGGVVTDWEGGPGYLTGDILAGPPQVHATLLELALAVRNRASVD